MKRAILLTGHFPQQQRKASLMWVSEHLQKMGWHVTHTTVGFSWLSVARRDARLAVLPHLPKRGFRPLSRSLSSLFGLPLIHPFNARSRITNSVLHSLLPMFTSHWARLLRDPITKADLIICESGPPVLLAPILAKYAPDAARVYRVNDDIRLLNASPTLIRAEKDNAKCFTRISTASPVLANRFSNHPNVTLDPMGIPHDALTSIPPNPYQGGRKTAVCAGTTQIDLPALARIADARPNWDIHLLGRLRTEPPKRPNIYWHGEIAFKETLAFIAHADIGLAAYVDAPGVEYQATNSNRILLYRHFGLPILGPDRLCRLDTPSIIGYSDPNAWFRCETYIRQPELIDDWSRLAERLTQNGETVPPKDVSIDPFSTEKSRVNTVPAFASKA